MTWRNRQLFKNSCGNLILAKLSFIVPQIRRTSGRERASKSKKLREKIFSYGVFNEQKVYSQKFFISSYKTHSSALWEYAEKEEDKRQNGQNWCATLFSGRQPLAISDGTPLRTRLSSAGPFICTLLNLYLSFYKVLCFDIFILDNNKIMHFHWL